MRKTFYTVLFLLLATLIFQESFSQVTPNYSTTTTTTKKVYYTYSRPQWMISLGPVWNLATNDAYGRANYADPDNILRDNYGMRWGWGGYLDVKFAPGKKRNDRIYLGMDYKGMTNADMDGSNANKTHYDIITIAGGYEYLFYGTYGFRSYYGIGLTGNIISGNFTPLHESASNPYKSFESSFRMGMELKAGLEFVLGSKKNYGINFGARYNLMNLFNDDNATPLLGQHENMNLNDGKDGTAGFKRYIGVVSINLGLNLYPDVKRMVRK